MQTKIIATIGPSSSHVLKKIVEAGADIFRLNTKYESSEWHKKIIKKAKEINCQIMLDIKALKTIKWVKDIEFDYLAVSYAETSSQIKKIRKMFPKKIKVISKIETRKGINNIDSLIKESDGIMVARGDLGKNISYEKVPLAQKMIIKKCNEKNKMVITATEMLLSITKSKVPERSEVSDIANAVLDGSDAVMLSEETAIGRYPVLAVKIMDKIVKETEKNMDKL